MKSSSSNVRSSRIGSLRAFSLVEVTLALGIASFGLVAAVGLIPVGLTTMRDAMDDTAQSMISHRISSEAALTPFAELDAKYDGANLYFDDEGQLQDREGDFTRYRVTTSVEDIVFPGSQMASAQGLALASNVKVIEVEVRTSSVDGAENETSGTFSIPVAAGS